MKRVLFAILIFATLSLSAQRAATSPQDDRSCWGSDKPCADGQYRDHLGNEQPATCNNNASTAEAHKCHCAKDTTTLEQCPENNMQMDMSKCQVYCREDACGCITVCDFNNAAK